MGLKRLLTKIVDYIVETAELNEEYYTGKKRRDYTTNKKSLPVDLSKNTTTTSLGGTMSDRIQFTLDVCVGLAEKLNTTTDPDEYFGSWYGFEQAINILKQYEPYGVFTDSLPSKDYAEALAKKEANTKEFITRSYEHMKNRFIAVKGVDAKSNVFNAYFRTISSYHDDISPENHEYIRQLVKKDDAVYWFTREDMQYDLNR